MARKFTSGFEVDGAGIDTLGSGFNPGVSRDTGTFRTGSASLKCTTAASTQGNTLVQTTWTPAYSSNTGYIRAYINTDGYPTSALQFLCSTTAGTSNSAIVKMTSTGTLQLWNSAASPAQIGSDSTALNTGTWYRVELATLFVSPTSITATLLLDGTQVATGTFTNSGTSSGAFQFRLGWTGTSTATTNMYFDDVAVNDESGAANNTYPGSGKVVLLVPTADSAVGTGWTLGTGTAISGNSGSTAVKNTPPLGVADLAAGSDTKQIRNATSNASVNYDATLTTYTAAGIGAADTVNAVTVVTSTAAPVTTSAKQGLVGMVSNPAITTSALAAGGTSGAFWSGTAAGTYFTGWKPSHSTVADAPSVTLGTAPVARITQTTANTRVAMVSFLGAYVDYTPATITPPNPTIVLASRSRAASW